MEVTASTGEHTTEPLTGNILANPTKPAEPAGLVRLGQQKPHRLEVPQLLATIYVTIGKIRCRTLLPLPQLDQTNERVSSMEIPTCWKAPSLCGQVDQDRP